MDSKVSKLALDISLPLFISLLYLNEEWSQEELFMGVDSIIFVLSSMVGRLTAGQLFRHNTVRLKMLYDYLPCRNLSSEAQTGLF